MEFSNRKRTKKIKLIYNLIGVVIITGGLYFFWKKNDPVMYGFLVALGIYIALSFVLGFKYIFFSTEGNKVILRYYPVISFLGRNYSSIEFLKTSMKDYEINKTFPFRNISFTIKTKRGIADYPDVGLNALSKAEINMIREELEKILNHDNSTKH